MSVTYTERLGRAETASDFTRERGLCCAVWSHYAIVRDGSGYKMEPFSFAKSHTYGTHWRVALNRDEAVIGVHWCVPDEPPDWGEARPALLAYFNGGGGSVLSLTPPERCWEQD